MAVGSWKLPRSKSLSVTFCAACGVDVGAADPPDPPDPQAASARPVATTAASAVTRLIMMPSPPMDWSACRSEEHTSELQSRPHLVCRLLLEKKKKNKRRNIITQNKTQKKKK